MLLKTMENLNITENNIVNKPMIINHQYTNKFRWYHYLTQIIYCLNGFIPAVLMMLIKVKNMNFDNVEAFIVNIPNQEVKNFLNNIGLKETLRALFNDISNDRNRNKFIISVICLIIPSMYTIYVIYKMYKYNSIKDHVAIENPNEYGIRKEALFFTLSLPILLITFILSLIIGGNLFGINLSKTHNLAGILIVSIIVYILIQSIGIRPMDLYYRQCYLPARQSQQTASAAQE